MAFKIECIWRRFKYGNDGKTGSDFSAGWGGIFYT